MSKLISLFFVLFSLLYFSNIVLADTGSAELIEKGKEYDGRVVVFSGEVIGDPMSRGAYLWLNVKDKDNAMGIWVRKNLLPMNKYYGSYKNAGDIMMVKGIFHRSCIEHGGDMDIHAASISLLRVGHPLKHHIQTYKFVMAVITLLTACLAIILYRLKEKRLNNI